MFPERRIGNSGKSFIKAILHQKASHLNTRAWFEEPAEALEDPIRFMAYAMKSATHDDMKALRRYVSDDDFREALDKAPPGIIDPRSWA